MVQTDTNRFNSSRNASERSDGSRPGCSAAWKASIGVLEGLAADEPHGVAGRAGGVGPQGVDRHDTGMLEPSGDLGLLEEPAQALGVAGAAGLEELERHLAVELGVSGQEDLAQGAGGVEAEFAELGPRRGRLSARSAGRRGGRRFAADRVDPVQEWVEPQQQVDAAPERIRPARGKWSRALRRRGSRPCSWSSSQRNSNSSSRGSAPLAGATHRCTSRSR